MGFLGKLFGSGKKKDASPVKSSGNDSPAKYQATVAATNDSQVEGTQQQAKQQPQPQQAQQQGTSGTGAVSSTETSPNQIQNNANNSTEVDDEMEELERLIAKKAELEKKRTQIQQQKKQGHNHQSSNIVTGGPGGQSDMISEAGSLQKKSQFGTGQANASGATTVGRDGNNSYSEDIYSNSNSNWDSTSNINQVSNNIMKNNQTNSNQSQNQQNNTKNDRDSPTFGTPSPKANKNNGTSSSNKKTQQHQKALENFLDSSASEDEYGSSVKKPKLNQFGGKNHKASPSHRGGQQYNKQQYQQKGANMKSVDDQVVYRLATVVASFEPMGDNQIGVTKREVLKVLDDSTANEYGWVWCSRRYDDADQGWVPLNCLDVDSNGNGQYMQESAQGNKQQSYPLQSDRSEQHHQDHNDDGNADIDANDPLSQWSDKLSDTFVLHSMRNIVRLVQYVVNLLNPYGAATSLHIACWRGSIDAVEVLLNSDPDLVKRLHSTTGQLTPLHVATICNFPEVVQFLLDARANCNIPTVHELTPLHLAASANSELVEILVSARANVDAEDADGNTPTIFAACYHQVETLEYLIDKSADVRKCNRWDVSPCHLTSAYVELEGGLFSMQLICSAGGDPWLKDQGNLTPLNVCKKILGVGSNAKNQQNSNHPVLEFINQFSGVAKLKPAARQAVLKKKRRDREAKDASRQLEEEERRKQEQNELYNDDYNDGEDHGGQYGSQQEGGGGKVFSRSESKAQLEAQASTIAGELQAENQNLANQVRSLKSEIDRLKLDLDQAKQNSSANSDLEKQLQQNRKNQEFEFDQRIKEKENELKKKIKSLEEQRDKLIQDHKQEKELQDKLMNDRMKSAKELDSKNKASSGEVAALSVKVGTLESEVKSKNEEIQHVKKEKEAFEEQLSRIKEEKAKSERSIKAELDEKREKIMLIERELKETTIKCEKAEKEIAANNTKLEKLDDYITRAEKAERALAPLEQRNIQLESMFAEEQAIRRKYHNQIQELKGAIRVYCRIRPRIKKEIKDNEAIALKKEDEFSIMLKREAKRDDKCYTFDGIFDENSTQDQVFKDCKDLIQSAVDGYNVTIFAYGQTGAGKTHTMYGASSSEDESLWGLVPRTVKEIFRMKNSQSNRYEIKIKMYMVEVYRDDLTDLLLQDNKKGGGGGPKKEAVSLEIKRDNRGTVYIDGVTEILVENEKEMSATLDRGMDKRHVAATKMNTDSSRSHLISTFLLEIYNRSKKTTSLGKITLVDLAGSERLKKSEASGEQMKEALAINKSLTALGDVIESLTSKAKHIPYRNHKLTELMSDSLGGNAKTLMFANCSPAASNAEETMGTLNYATRAKQITNNVSKQQESKEVSRLKQVIATMSKEMEMRNQVGGPSEAGLKEALLGL